MQYLKYKYLKLTLRVLLAHHTVAMVTYSVPKTNIFTIDCNFLIIPPFYHDCSIN